MKMLKKYVLSGWLIAALFPVMLSANSGKSGGSLDAKLPEIKVVCADVGRYVQLKEAAVPDIKPGNSSQVIYFDEGAKSQTEYCLLYLHGFSASPMEGYPSHVNLGRAFGMNTYIPRLAEHGLNTPDALLNMTPSALWESAKEALVLARALGKKVIVMGTSTGGTLALKLAADFPEDVAALLLYSPNIRIANPAAGLLGGPFGLQLGRMIAGGKERILPENPKTDPYWYNRYRVEGVVYLQKLLVKTMKTSVFKEVKQPLFVGYYYKDKENQDQTVSVAAILKMFDKLGTSPELKEAVAFPDAGDHVIGCELTNPNWKKVYDETAAFLEQRMHLTRAGK